MSLPVSPRNLKRYVDIARLIARHWNAGWAAPDAEVDESARADEPDDDERSARLSDDLERMGPTFIKLGQLLSTRPDITPPRLRKDLARLQSEVTPVDEDEIREAVERELGAKVSSLFSEFEPVPLATASLAQVHAARLRDGRPVVVKVRRPGVADSVRADMSVVGDVAGWLEAHTSLEDRFGLSSTLRDLGAAVERELDYRLEARNLDRIRRIVSGYDRLVVPEVIADYSSTGVLTMERIAGVNLGRISPLRRLEGDHDALARQLFRAYLDQALVHGVVHADPHPGNVMITDDGRLALIDLGMIATVPSAMRDRLLRLILAIAEGEGSAAARIGESLGTPLEDFDAEAFRHAIATRVILHDSSDDGDSLGRTFAQLTALSGAHGLRPDPSLALLGKTLLNLEETGRLLAPDFEPDREARQYAPLLLLKRAEVEASPTAALRKSLAVKDLLATLPDRAERILDQFESGDFRTRIDLGGEDRIVRALTRVANRITEGLVLAALVIGAALMFRVDTTFRIFGYPGIAMILFGLATLGGVRVLWTIARDDEG